MYNRAYWAKRIAEQQETLYGSSLYDTQKALATAYTNSLKAIEKDVKSLYDEILIDGVPNTTELYKFNRFMDLSKDLNKKLKTLGYKEIEINSSNLMNLYNATGKLIMKEAPLEFAAIVNNKAGKAAVDIVWCSDGKHWSDRIWSNKSGLQSRIEKGLIDSVARGASKADLIKTLQTDLNVGYYQSDRIARTELNYIQNKAAADKYREAGVEKYKVLANQADDDCADKDGEEHLLADAEVGFNYPPFHPNCRCTVIAVIE